MIELDPSGVSVLAPSSATLMCTARGEPPPDIVWAKEVNGDETVYNSSQSRFSITTVQSTATSTSTLTINTTEALDTANYSCVAENRFGSARSQQAEVTVFGELYVCTLDSSFHLLALSLFHNSYANN